MHPVAHRDREMRPVATIERGTSSRNLLSALLRTVTTFARSDVGERRWARTRISTRELVASVDSAGDSLMPACTRHGALPSANVIRHSSLYNSSWIGGFFSRRIAIRCTRRTK